MQQAGKNSQQEAKRLGQGKKNNGQVRKNNGTRNEKQRDKAGKTMGQVILKSATIIQYTIKGRFMSR